MNALRQYQEQAERWAGLVRRGRKGPIIACGVVALMLLVICGLAEAQQSSATINGEVRDSSGAVIQGASVILTNQATNVKKVTVTNNSGVYLFNNVTPGDYSFSVSKEGFNPSAEQNFHVEVNQSLTQDFTLATGSVTQRVVVQASQVELNTADASIGDVIQPKQVDDLPLNGRNFTALLILSPGVSPINTGQNGPNGGGGQANPVGQFVAPAINGQYVRSNYYLLDGIDDTEMNYDLPSYWPTVDDIQEFKVQSHNDESEFGGVVGGIVNLVTKSGTNQYQGVVWEYLRNTVFDAANPTSGNPQKLVQNQFGANGGGPLIIPHLYDGRNRSFVFGSYEGFRLAQPLSSAGYLVPTAAQLAGDFSGICQTGFSSTGICNDRSSTGIIENQIYNPFSTAVDPTTGLLTRTPFPYNNVASVLNAQAVGFAQAYFPPAQATRVVNGAVVNGIDPRSLLTNQNDWSVRGDENFNPSNSAFFRYSSRSQPNVGPAGETTNFTLDRTVTAQQYVASYVHEFGPTSIFDFQFGHNMMTNAQITKFNGNTQSVISAAGIDSSFACSFSGGFSPCVIPSLGIPDNIAGGGSGESTTELSNVYQWRGGYTKTFRTHSLSGGFSWENDSFHVINTSATITYSNEQTASSIPAEQSVTGNGLAAFLMGVAAQGNRRETIAPLTGQRAGGFYVMDKWKASDRLTVNLGLREDMQINGTYGSALGGTYYVSNVDFSNGSYILQKEPGNCDTLGQAPCIPGGTLPANVTVSSNGHIYVNNLNNWQPRIGVAYRANNQLVLRGGFGIFDDLWGGITQSIQNIGGTWPSLGQVQSPTTNSPTTVATVNWQNPLASLGNADIPPATPFGQQQWFRDPHAKIPYSEQWNVGFQQQFGGTIVSGNYVGSQTHRLMVGNLYNVALYPGPGTLDEVIAREPYPYITPTFYDRPIGNSSYNALQLSATHPPVKGLSYSVAYTWSKSINLGCDGSITENCSIQNPYDLRPDRSVAGTDVPQVFAASFTAESPVGKNKYFSTNNGFADYLLGNWQLNGIFGATSGQDYTLTVSGDIPNVNHAVSWDNFVRPNLVGSPIYPNRSPKEWFNKAAFQIPAPYTFGNFGRNALRGDTFFNTDMSLFRSFPIGEKRSFQFRVEAFNIFNHPVWGLPDSNFQDPNFGTITSTRSTERQLQFALKLYY